MDVARLTSAWAQSGKDGISVWEYRLQERRVSKNAREDWNAWWHVAGLCVVHVKSLNVWLEGASGWISRMCRINRTAHFTCLIQYTFYDFIPTYNYYYTTIITTILNTIHSIIHYTLYVCHCMILQSYFIISKLSFTLFFFNYVCFRILNYSINLQELNRSIPKSFKTYISKRCNWKRKSTTKS